MLIRRMSLIVALVLLAGCGSLRLGTPGATSLPPSGTTAAQNFLPNLAGYVATDADSIADALSTVGVNAVSILGNQVVAALVQRIDSMIQCYQSAGAVAARVYTDASITTIAQGEIPRLGAVAVLNETRLRNALLPCALGGSGTFSAQAAEPCAGSGTLVVNNENIHYIYAATSQDLCTLFAQSFTAR